MEPFLTGGHMIRSVAAEETTWGELPHKFEAGTAPMAEAVGFGAAIDYLEAIGFDAIERHEHDLAAFALEQLAELPWVTAWRSRRRTGAPGSSVQRRRRASHDVAQVLDFEGVAIRAGHHCCQPLMRSSESPRPTAQLLPVHHPRGGRAPDRRPAPGPGVR